jgi:hypothetical protein
VPVVDLSCTRWRKSSRSGSAGNTNCVEIAFGPASWRESSRSGGVGGNHRVEVTSAGTATGVRDSKNPDGAALVFAHAAWQEFHRAARDGLFDVPV